MVNNLVHLFYLCHMVLLMVMSKFIMGSFCCFSISMYTFFFFDNLTVTTSGGEGGFESWFSS